MLEKYAKRRFFFASSKSKTKKKTQTEMPLQTPVYEFFAQNDEWSALRITCEHVKANEYMTTGCLRVPDMPVTFVNLAMRSEVVTCFRSSTTWNSMPGRTTAVKTQRTPAGNSMTIDAHPTCEWVTRVRSVDTIKDAATADPGTFYIVIIDEPPTDEVVDAIACLKELPCNSCPANMHVLLFTAKHAHFVVDGTRIKKQKISLSFPDKFLTLTVPPLEFCEFDTVLKCMYGSRKSSVDVKQYVTETIELPSSCVVDPKHRFLVHTTDSIAPASVSFGKHNIKFQARATDPVSVTLVVRMTDDTATVAAVSDMSPVYTQWLGYVLDASDEVAPACMVVYRMMVCDDAMTNFLKTQEDCRQLWTLCIDRIRSEWLRASSEMLGRPDLGEIAPPVPRPVCPVHSHF